MTRHAQNRRRLMFCLLTASLIISSAESAAWADAVQADPAAATPAAPAVSATLASTPAEPSAVGLEMPDLSFTETPEIVNGYDKFFYFHRENTTFLEAYNDLRECDALANGSSIYMGDLATTDPGYMAGQYGIGGVIGEAVGMILVDAIFGASQRRKEKRIKIRNCMGFKDYQRYGLPKGLWQKLNAKPKKDDPKQTPDYSLRLRALLASGPTPTLKVLPK